MAAVPLAQQPEHGKPIAEAEVIGADRVSVSARRAQFYSTDL